MKITKRRYSTCSQLFILLLVFNNPTHSWWRVVERALDDKSVECWGMDLSPCWMNAAGSNLGHYDKCRDLLDRCRLEDRVLDHELIATKYCHDDGEGWGWWRGGDGGAKRTVARRLTLQLIRLSLLAQDCGDSSDSFLDWYYETVSLHWLSCNTQHICYLASALLLSGWLRSSLVRISETSQLLNNRLSGGQFKIYRKN